MSLMSSSILETAIVSFQVSSCLFILNLASVFDERYSPDISGFQSLVAFGIHISVSESSQLNSSTPNSNDLVSSNNLFSSESRTFWNDFLF